MGLKIRSQDNIMVSAHDVPASKLIAALAEHLKKLPGMEAPEWASFVKTGSQADRPPIQPDWWFPRAGSLLRKLYLRGPAGLSELERVYGGAKAVGYAFRHHRDAGSSVIRRILKQLEQAELVAKTPKGRILTPKGVALLDKVSKDIFKQLAEERPPLVRYG
jgi:small subunit ribosomal protein S19e